MSTEESFSNSTMVLDEVQAFPHRVGPPQGGAQKDKQENATVID